MLLMTKANVPKVFFSFMVFHILTPEKYNLVKERVRHNKERKGGDLT